MAAFGLLSAVPIVVGTVQNASAEILYIRGIDAGVGTWVINTDTGSSWFLPD